MRNILLLVAFFCAAFTAPLSAQDLNAELTAFGKAWQEANNRGDAEGLSTMYTDEVVMVNAKDGSKTTVTKAQIKARDTQNFGESDNQITIVNDKTEALSDGKVRIVGTFSGVMTNKKSGEKSNFSGSYDHLAVKEGGQWKLCQMKSVFNQ